MLLLNLKKGNSLRFKLFIIIAIILSTIIYLTHEDNHVNSNAHIDTSLNIYDSDVSKNDIVLTSEKNEIIESIKKSPSIAPVENRQLRGKNKPKKAVESVNINETEDISQDLLINMNKLFESAKSKKWSEFYGAVDFLDTLDQGTLDLALFQASINDAPINIIKDLLSRGALFSPQIINMLAMQNKLNLIKKLVPLGLDIYTTDEHGRTAIYYTLLTFNSKQTFNYLISQNVSSKSIQNILDPLDKALEYTMGSNAGIYYIDILIDDGAQIQKSHKDYLEKIKHNNNQAYLEIISKHPEFI